MNNNEITFFAKTNFRNQERVFGIKTDDRRRHMYIIGKTGMGKTNLLENLVVQDIRNGHGVCYIDPHGDTAEKLLKSVPAHRINDVIYFNPADQAFPISFNVMETIDPEYRHLVASGLVGVFKKIWADSWGPRLEYILRNAIMALLEYPDSTLLGVTRILVDKKYRELVVAKVTDPVIRQFWTEEFPKWSDKVLQEVVSPIQNKVGQFLSNSLIRNIVGQTKSSFDVREIMDSQKILIMNLSKGRIGEDSSALLGAMMITKIQLAAMGRVDMEEEKRADFYLYVDEFQNFSTESFANILSEARKYRLNLILANQYVEQIMETVRNAIFGNVGTIISFRVGAMDAEFLEKEFAPVFYQTDIVNLQKYHIYLKLMIDGIAGDAFSATTLPPIYIDDTLENEPKIIAISRERYAEPREVVEDKINRWSGILPPPVVIAMNAQGQYMAPSIVTSQTRSANTPVREFSAPVAATQNFPQEISVSQIDQQAPVSLQPTADVQPQLEPKVLYQAHCETCGDEIQVPFKPDGKRPTFCKDCLKDHQRMQAKAKLKIERDAQRKLNSQQVANNEQQKSQNQEQDNREKALVTGHQSLGSQEMSRQQEQSSTKKFEKPRRSFEKKAFVPRERPLSLSQMQHIGPKKFRPRPQVNLGEVRDLIKKNSDQK